MQQLHSFVPFSHSRQPDNSFLYQSFKGEVALWITLRFSTVWVRETHHPRHFATWLSSRFAYIFPPNLVFQVCFKVVFIPGQNKERVDRWINCWSSCAACSFSWSWNMLISIFDEKENISPSCNLSGVHGQARTWRCILVKTCDLAN